MPTEYAITIAFLVDRILEVRLLDDGLDGMSFRETAVTDPYVHYDDIEAAAPTRWPERFHVSRWAFCAPARTGRGSAVR